MKHLTKAFTLLEILVVLTVIGVLTGAAVPKYQQFVADSRRDMCITNLKLIEQAITIWETRNQRLFANQKYRFRFQPSDGGIWDMYPVSTTSRRPSGTNIATIIGDPLAFACPDLVRRYGDRKKIPINSTATAYLWVQRTSPYDDETPSGWDHRDDFGTGEIRNAICPAFGRPGQGVPTTVFSSLPPADGVTSSQLVYLPFHGSDYTREKLHYDRNLSTTRPWYVKADISGPGGKTVDSVQYFPLGMELTITTTWGDNMEGLNPKVVEVLANGNPITPPSKTQWTPPKAGEYTVSVRASDDPGNIRFSTPKRIIITSPPTVTMTSTAAEPTDRVPIPVTVTFNVAVTGFEEGDMELSPGASILNWTVVKPGLEYSFGLSFPNVDGEVWADIPAGVAQDGFGSKTLVAPRFTRTFKQMAVPWITISTPSAYLTTAGPVYYDVTYYNADSVSLQPGNVTLAKSGTAVAATPEVTPTGLMTNRITLKGVGGTGKMGISIAGSTASNSVGFAATTPVSEMFEVDNSQPTGQLARVCGDPTSNNPILITMTFSEDVTGFTLSSMNVTNATAYPALSWPNPGHYYPIWLAPVASQCTISVSIPTTNKFKDLTGHDNVDIAALPSFRYDGTSVLASTSDDLASFVASLSAQLEDVKETIASLTFGNNLLPAMVQTGLVLYLDAGKSESYPGSGAVWKDLSGKGNHGTLVGPAFNAGNGGNFVFDGNDTVSLPTVLPSYPFTVSMWVTNDLIWKPGGGTMDELFNMNIAGQRVSMGIEDVWSNPAQISLMYGGTNCWSCSRPQQTLNSNWNNIVWVVYGSNDPRHAVYINGVSQIMTNRGGVHDGNPGWNVGSNSGGSEYWPGKIACVMVYDRALSSTEIIQNYSTFSPRFGQSYETAALASALASSVASLSQSIWDIQAALASITTWVKPPMNVVKDGLVLHLDAADQKSYPGYGSTWRDLSDFGNDGTLINGPTYSTAYSGVLNLNGSTQYIRVPIDLSTKNHTIIGAARYLAVGGRIFSGLFNNWLMGHWSSSTLNHYAEGWVSPVQNGPGDTVWRILAATGNYSDDSWALYENGVLISGPNSRGSRGPNGFAIGIYGPGLSEFSKSQISFLLAYDRLLSPQEILYTYDIFKSRFGIKGKSIALFDFEGLSPRIAGTINQAAKTVTLVVPLETDLTALTPTIMHTGASIFPNSGESQNFTNPVTYTVKDVDGIPQSYVVTVVPAPPISPTSGGHAVDVGDYRLHVFKNSGKFTSRDAGVYDVLVVAGGGGGGMDMGGGGGGGGMIFKTGYAVTAGQAITVTVGDGGAGAPAGSSAGNPGGHQFTKPAFNGGNSVFGSLTAIGGGRGGSSYMDYSPGAAGAGGGSGGGASGYTPGRVVAGGAGTSGQGNAGSSSGGNSYYPGGGGGAGAPGSRWPATGGAGKYCDILGIPYYFGGGGGGSGYQGSGGNGGTGGGGGGATGVTKGGAFGNVTEKNGYRIHTFLESGTFVSPVCGVFDVLIVAGGGGGGSDMGGGGGGGGVIYIPGYAVASGQSVAIIVGAGGAGAPAGTGQARGTDGSDSSIGTIQETLTAIGGGGGASGHSYNTSPGGNGGSGGGCSGAGGLVSATYGGIRGLGTPGQGYDGGASIGTWYPGGGGGAGGAGTRNPAHGGVGTATSILGSTYYFGGGGGGSGYSCNGGNGGNGGGGGGAVGATAGGAGINNGSGGGGGSINSQTNTPGGNAGANTGGGGGGGSHYNSNNKGGDGGSGVVIIRYPVPNDGSENFLGIFGSNAGAPGGGGSPNSWTNKPGGDGAANTGGGGGGGSHYNASNKGGNGGSGLVVVRCPKPTDGSVVNVVDSDGYRIHTFLESGTFIPPITKSVEVLVVAGGGGGGMDIGGGGGGGGVIFDNGYPVTRNQPIAVTVGKGGAGAPAGGTFGQPTAHQFTIPAKNGENSVFGTLTAIGGGRGGSSYMDYAPGAAGAAGGSGGGASGYTPGRVVAGGAGTSGQGNAGGSSGGNNYYPGGGGGAGGVGTRWPGNGGPGLLISIDGRYYGGGGGGSGHEGNGGNGGTGGGGGGASWNGYASSGGTGGRNNGGGGGVGNYTQGGDGGANTGGGGGGGTHYNFSNRGGNGGSGIVIIRYRL
ncbi:MAG: glycine-rich domain-containing protein [Candidatus Ozemobacteraceae bacterium]